MLDIPPPRIGLALGSGAARGWAHIGVLHALNELGIHIDVICGTSIGALVGGFYLSGRLADLEAWARRLTTLRLVRYLDLGFMRKNGLVAGGRLFAEMEAAIGKETIEGLPIPFATIATDLHTGHEVWISEGRLMDAIRASFAIPGLFEPMRIGHRWVIDGAIVNPVPVSVCRALGAQVIIAINLNTASPAVRRMPAPQGRLQPGMDPVSGAPGLFPSSFEDADRNGGKRKGRRKGRKAAASADPNLVSPRLLSVIAATLNIVQDRVTRSRLAADPPDISIVPKVGHISLMDFQTAAELIDRGAAAVFQAEAEIRNTLAMVEEIQS